MVQGIAAECMHNHDQSNEEGVRSLNMISIQSVQKAMCYLFSYLK